MRLGQSLSLCGFSSESGKKSEREMMCRTKEESGVAVSREKGRVKGTRCGGEE